MKTKKDGLRTQVVPNDIKDFEIIFETIIILKSSSKLFKVFAESRNLQSKFIYFLMHKNLPFLLLLVVLASAGLTQYKKVIPNINPEAKCLDGSPSFLYVNEGSDPNNFLIYVLGGGACGGFNLETTLESCY